MGCGISNAQDGTAKGKQFPGNPYVCDTPDTATVEGSYAREGQSPEVEKQRTIAPIEDSQGQVERPKSETSQAGFGEASQGGFGETINYVADQLRLRQKNRKELSKEELENLMQLTREMENFKSVMKNSQYTVEATWNILEKEGMVDRFGQQLYDQLLTKNPRLRVYFYGVDLDEQSKTIVRMLGTAVHSYNNPVRTVEFITRAGARHRGYGVTPSVFREMEVAFFKVFPKFVGLDVFEASEDYWKDFWAVVLDLLSRGCESKEGDSYGQMYEIRNAEQIQSDFRIIIDRQRKFDTRHQFVGIMYAKAIEMFGDFSKFDALKDLRAANAVFDSFCHIFTNMLDKEKVAEYMYDLGARHLLYNVSYDNLVSFTEPFLFTCRHFMEDEWNVAMESRFLWAFRYIIDGIGPGMQNVYHGSSNTNNDAISSESADQSGNATFCLIFTDIEGNSKLWQKNPQAMGIAVKQHNRLIRSLIKKYEAYEVKTVGDSFIIAAKDILVGVKIALAIQLELMRMAPIAPHFEMLENTEGRGDASCWDSRTLRVSIGLEHCTEATATYDTVHERYDYYGPSVNRCARIEAAACGGQILLSRQSFEALKSIPDFRSETCDPYFRDLEMPSSSSIQDGQGLNHFVSVSDAGVVSLKGIGHSVQLVSMVPSCLSGRQFIDKTSLSDKE